MEQVNLWIARMRRTSRPDAEWARLAGVDVHTVWAWRRSVGLPSHQERTRERAVRRMRRDPARYNTEIARRFKVSERSVWRWRLDAGIPPAHVVRRQRREAELRDRVEAAAADWTTVAEICERSGLSATPVRRTIHALRQARRLEMRARPVGTGWEYRASLGVPDAP